MDIKLKGYHKGTLKEIDHKEVLRLMYNAACDVWPENLKAYHIVPFINIHDSDKNELFEGDILEGFSQVLEKNCTEYDLATGQKPKYIEKKYIFYIVFKDGVFECFRNDEKHFFGIHFCLRSKKIGNIYQNKDLIV